MSARRLSRRFVFLAAVPPLLALPVLDWILSPAPALPVAPVLSTSEASAPAAPPSSTPRVPSLKPPTQVLASPPAAPLRRLARRPETLADHAEVVCSPLVADSDRQASLGALALQGGPAAEAVLRDLAYVSDARARELVAPVLAQRPALAEAWRSLITDAVPAVRLAAARAATQSGPLLMRAHLESDPRVRVGLVEALSRIADAPGLQALERWAASSAHDAPFARRAAAQVRARLSRRG